MAEPMRCSAAVVGRPLAYRSSDDETPRCRRNSKAGELCSQHAAVAAREMRKRYGFVRLSREEIEWIRSLP